MEPERPVPTPLVTLTAPPVDPPLPPSDPAPPVAAFASSDRRHRCRCSRLLCASAQPAARVMIPPVLDAAEVSPAASEKPPPSPTSPLPKVNDIDPPAPPVASPVVKLISPADPPEASPVRMLTPPVVPEVESPVLTAMPPLTQTSRFRCSRSYSRSRRKSPSWRSRSSWSPSRPSPDAARHTHGAARVSPDATRDGHGATHSPAAAITDASRQRQRASRGAVSGGLASRHGHRPAGAGVAIPHAQGKSHPPAPPVALPVSTVNAPSPRRPTPRLSAPCRR